MTGRPLALVTNQASTAKIKTANRIDVNFRRVEMESGTKATSMFVVIAYFCREKGTNPSPFGICTFAKVCASITALASMIPLSWRM